MNTSIDLTTLFWICSGIAGIYAVWKIVKGPFVKLDDHERRITNVEKTLIERKDTDTLILKSLNAITNHMIDGNGIEKLKASRDELQRGIIEHQK
ncbi:MAG: hypothetical protein IIW12_10260 [Oscillospiraceae bacterium]|nr:hypothetical protein [Oscillospiraceae bacterium]